MAVVSNGPTSMDSQSWLGAVDVGYLTEAERDAILDVLQRDEHIRRTDHERVSKLKTQLRDVRRKGAKRADNSYSTRVCARCNNKTGIIFNAPSQCPVCKHKVCQQCMTTGIFSKSWKCIVCYQEVKLKAETGEWFYGLMRPELRSMKDGSTVVKQAVLTKPVHFDQRSASHTRSAPAITCTPASSNSKSSSKKDTSSVNSLGTEDTGSSTESRKHRSRRDKLGPAETGSIGLLRKTQTLKQTVSGSSVDSAASWSPQKKSSTLPTHSARPQKPPRIADLAILLMAQKKNQSKLELTKQYSGPEDIDTHPFLLLPRKNHDVYEAMDDGMSEASVESKSIDGVFEEYIQSQRAAEERKAALDQAQSRREKYSHSNSQESYNSEHSNAERARYQGETEDHISTLSSPRVSALPRRLNEKLLRQNKLSVSVPTVYHPANRKSNADAMSTQSGLDQESVEYPLSMNRDLSTSVPNLAQSTTSLNSAGLHDLPITGEIKFSLSYMYKTNILLVNVAECRNVATADRRRKRSDPYVKCYLLPDRKNKQKTEVKKRTTNPVYNKCLKFSVNHSELSTRVLELSVWHAGTFTRNLFLGQVQVPLDSWNWDSTNQNWFPLRQREGINADFVKETMYKGDLILGLKFVSSASASPGKHKGPFGELNILIKQAKNLTPVRSNGTVDAYVKIMLQPDKQFRQKTPVIPKTSSPEWNYNIRMQLYQPMEESSLQLTIWHRDKLQSPTPLGGCRLNLGPDGGDQKWMDASGAEKSLWQAAIDAPEQWVDTSLPLRPSL